MARLGIADSVMEEVLIRLEGIEGEKQSGSGAGEERND